MARLRRCLAFALPLLGCGRLEHDCRNLSTTANAFIATSEKQRLRPEASPTETARAARDTATRYDRLAADLMALSVRSSELQPEVASYRELALHSAAALRAVAKALDERDFETARKKRVELDQFVRGEGPLVAKINALCSGTPAPAKSAP